MTPIERGARAICGEFGVDPDYLMTEEDDAYVGFGLRPRHLAWNRYAGMVRAVLLAVRQPSDGMKAVVDRRAEEVNAQFDISPEEVWHLMIDAAIDEGDGGALKINMQ